MSPLGLSERERGWDAIAGSTTTRRALAVAISVWYDEPYHQTKAFFEK